jgi:hypothetical protein
MKNLLAIVLCAFALSAFAAEPQKVCVDVKDAKTGKTKQECKMMKTHKKLEVESDKKK